MFIGYYIIVLYSVLMYFAVEKKKKKKEKKIIIGTVPTSLLSVVLNTPCLAEKQQLQFYGHSHISYQR
jgi:uncharacterized membrane protein